MKIIIYCLFFLYIYWKIVSLYYFIIIYLLCYFIYWIFFLSFTVYSFVNHLPVTLVVSNHLIDFAVKKGYHKVSLKVHPDRCEAEEKEEATRKFQTLGRVYKLLADKDLRSVYDETGQSDWLLFIHLISY